MESTPRIRPYPKVITVSFVVITLTHAVCAFLTYDQGHFLWQLGVLITLGIYFISLIPYGISLWLFKKNHTNRGIPLWEWTCFGLFALINITIIYLNILEFNRPYHWPFG